MFSVHLKDAGGVETQKWVATPTATLAEGQDSLLWQGELVAGLPKSGN